MPIVLGSQAPVGAYSATLNSLPVGAGTYYRLVGMTGWFDVVSAPLGGNASLARKAQANGSWPMPYYVPSRIVTLLLAVEAPVDSFDGAVSALAQATQPQVDSYGQPVQIPVTVQLGGAAQTVYGTVTS
ncbi:MAG TPA: hypothetical protein VFH38_00735, partial [Jatrophihabitans sp.]|nr:hypothetical protein [Jatrophihabitans sp.]